MYHKSHNEVVERILSAARKQVAKPTVLEPLIRVGQVRTLSSLSESSAPQLVVVANIRPAHEEATVILLNNLVEIATTRDFLGTMADGTDHLDIVICADFFGLVRYTQLGSKVFGQACALCVEEVLAYSLNDTENIRASLPNHGCFKRGVYQPLVGEEVWHMRNTEFANFYDKTL